LNEPLLLMPRKWIMLGLTGRSRLTTMSTLLDKEMRRSDSSRRPFMIMNRGLMMSEEL